MYQLGTNHVYVYRHHTELELADLGGIYEKKQKRWKFDMSLLNDVVAYLKVNKDQNDLSESSSDDSEREPITKRLHRASSLVNSDDDLTEEEMTASDEEYFNGTKYRPKMTNVQLTKKKKILQRKLQTLKSVSPKSKSPKNMTCNGDRCVATSAM